MSEQIKDWTFDNLDFDKHVREQLPWYDLVTDAVSFMVRQYLPTDEGVVYDIGASTGNMSKAIRSVVLERDSTIISVEQNSAFAKQIDTDFNDEIYCEDAREHDYADFDICILFLTLMFIPINDRDDLMKTLKSKVRKGGVIIVVDKVADSSGYFATCLKRMTLYFKQKFVSIDEIAKKEISLAGVQRPVARDPDGQLFFKFGEFEGWVIESDK